MSKNINFLPMLHKNILELLMQIIDVNLDNIDSEHICCAISDKGDDVCVASKKAWLSERFQDGLVFKKLNARGKVFIEYIPAENAWLPIDAKGFLHINCLWVSGQFKGKGYANQLLDKCILDAKSRGKVGLTVLSSKKKMTFLSDPSYLKYKGFEVADKIFGDFELLYLKLSDTSIVPKIKDCARSGTIADKGMVLYYTNQCPFNAKYISIIQKIAEERGMNLKAIKISTKNDAQNAPTPITTYSFFYNGKFIRNEVFSDKKFIKFLDGNK